VHEDADLLAELERVDDPIYAEYPGGGVGWNQAAAEAQFLRLAETLAARLGCPVQERFPALNDPDYARVRERTLCFETGVFIQDASFHGEILVPRVLMTPEALREDYSVSLRTSNFGHLATLCDDDTKVQPTARETTIRVVEEWAIPTCRPGCSIGPTPAGIAVSMGSQRGPGATSIGSKQGSVQQPPTHFVHRDTALP
jgi:hypothetical protein